MSAVNSSLGDREHEALRRAQRAHEPSMEEILASIRTIIADEKEPAKPSEPLPSSGAPKAASPAPQPQVVYSRAAADPTRAPAAWPLRLEPGAAASRSAQPTARAGREAPADGGFGPLEGAEPLVSPETDKAVGSSLNALSASIATRSAELAQDMARDMLRPMLKAWLDENLPAIVDRLVRAEIDRISRGAGQTEPSLR